MAYEQLGTWVYRQWNQFKEFMAVQRLNYTDKRVYLMVKRMRLERAAHNLRMVDDMLGGSSLRGNPGSIDRKFGETPTIRGGESAEEVEGQMLQGTLCGGDLPWEAFPSNLYDLDSDKPFDTDIAEKISQVKYPLREMIRFKEERNEYRLKSIMRRISEIAGDIRVLDAIFVKGGLLDQYVQEIENRFNEPRLQDLEKRDDLLKQGDTEVREESIRTALFLDEEIQGDLVGNGFRGIPAHRLQLIKTRIENEIEKTVL